MVGRKWAILQNGEFLPLKDNVFYKAEHLEEWKNTAVKSLKNYGYKGLVGTIRFYFRSTNFLKRKYQEIKTEMEERRERKLSENGIKKVEANKFLKMISEYKHKIRKIKHQIKEEEENL
jgi:hypothetical protein